jgi:hypothetical protein
MQERNPNEYELLRFSSLAKRAEARGRPVRRSGEAAKEEGGSGAEAC